MMWEYNGFHFKLIKTKYFTGNLAIRLFYEDGDFYKDLTRNDINVCHHLLPDEAIVNTQGLDWAEDFILKNKLGEPTGRLVDSGYCLYPDKELEFPVYRFYLDKL